MGNLILGAFCAVLFIFIATGLPLLGALFIGFLLFAGYALHQGYGIKAVLAMAWEGIWRIRMLLVVFMLIGVLTGLWRASGTIAYIIAGAVSWIRPSIFLLLAFLLNCGISFLLGSSFATGATMGVITFSVGQSLGIPALCSGGAILSGAYFGDRMSPVSTSALLVSTLQEYRQYGPVGGRAFFPQCVTVCRHRLFCIALGNRGRYNDRAVGKSVPFYAAFAFAGAFYFAAQFFPGFREKEYAGEHCPGIFPGTFCPAAFGDRLIPNHGAGISYYESGHGAYAKRGRDSVHAAAVGHRLPVIFLFRNI